ncbi:MAG: hypothetical protein HeimC3_14670 [Candidatus Heimdallarchaeota archaeon LC_3]|nr:MAG: hypothetical protein HeimC3_14670 [Candidatus Heimdallarchaeota archaeon LC_3]
MKIYWQVLTHPLGVVGVREIQKSLKMSSSGSVSYQLNKLISVGIIAKTDKYYVREEVKTGILGFYYRIGYRVVPRFIFYLMFFILGLICFLFFAISRGDEYLLDPSNWLFLLILLFGTTIFIFESNKYGK